jgi:hypothetical protein
LIYLRHESLNKASKVWVALFDESFVPLEVTLDVVKELLEVLRVIHDKLANYRFVQIKRWELVGVALNNHGRHVGEMLGDSWSTLLHDEHVLVLNFLQEAAVGIDVL